MVLIGGRDLLSVEALMSFGYIGVFILLLAVNLIPFASPSNLVLAGAVVHFTSMNPALAAVLVAVSATFAKLAHFYLAALLGRRFDCRNSRLGRYGEIVGRWGALGAFLAAASPVPDDPVVIPLGLMRTDVMRFSAAYFAGKLIVTALGAYGMKAVELRLETLIGGSASIIGSVVLSVLLITILLRTDPRHIRRLTDRLRSRRSRVRSPCA
ncbi:MAG: VTT domain-containing protein [Candidatus Bathyarchaeia archaeon]